MIIRPSSLDTYNQCAQQWYRVFILGETSIPSTRAAIGTAIHKGVEVMWQDSMQAKTKIVAKSSMEDAAIDAYAEEEHRGLEYDFNESQAESHREIREGLNTYVEDILPMADIPTAVEVRYTVNISDHPIITAVSGTIDYLNIVGKHFSDVKTGKRKHNIANSETQQSIYKYLLVENGVDIQTSSIQNVVLKSKPEGHIMDSAINIKKAKAIVNDLLEVTRVYEQDVVDPNILFRGNPKYYLCSPKYCAFHSTCKWVGN